MNLELLDTITNMSLLEMLVGAFFVALHFLIVYGFVRYAIGDDE